MLSIHYELTSLYRPLPCQDHDVSVRPGHLALIDRALDRCAHVVERRSGWIAHAAILDQEDPFRLEDVYVGHHP